MSRTRLILIPTVAGKAAPCMIVDAAGTVLERSLLTLETPVEGPVIRTVAVVPGADVLVRWLDLPGGTAAQQRTAALWALKDDLAAAPDRVRLVLGPAVAGGRRIEPVEDMRRVEKMLIAAALSPPLNLLQGAPKVSGDLSRWRVAAMLAAGALALPLISTLALAARDEIAAGRANDRAEAAARAAFPDMPAAADPISEARRRIATAAPPGGAAPAAAALFAAVESVEGAELDSFSADPEGGVRATVSFRAYQDMDALKASVAAAGLTLTDTSTLDDNGRVVSDVIVGVGQ